MGQHKLIRGDTFELDITVYQPDGSTPFDLSGSKVWSTIKRQLSDADAQAVSRVDSVGTSIPTGGSVTISPTPTDGTVNVRHPASCTLGFDPACTSLVYDVQIKDQYDRVFTVDHGTITLEPDVTITET